MQILATSGNDDVAMVYVAEFKHQKRIELVESIQPPIPRSEKWVLLVSTLFGCPIKCKFCDAGGDYHGKLSEEQILKQIDFLIRRRFPTGVVPVKQLKIQFARVGEPSFNENTLAVLKKLPILYNAPGLMPSISTVAPKKSNQFLEEIHKIKDEYYSNGHFQMQFSIHTTDEKRRNELIPIPKLSFDEIADYGKNFYKTGDRKVVLNFALAKGIPIDSHVLKQYFDPLIFIIKITPLNPTYRALENNLESQFIDFIDKNDPIVSSIINEGYDVISSVGLLEENQIGSNCGQSIKQLELNNKIKLQNAYNYPVINYQEK